MTETPEIARLTETLAALPPAQRLQTVQDVIVPQIEAAGFDLAPHLNAGTVAAILRVACDLDTALRLVQSAVAEELRLRTV